MAAVLDLRPATTYHLRIVARNEIGDSDPSDTVTIITAEEGKTFSLNVLYTEKALSSRCMIGMIIYYILFRILYIFVSLLAMFNVE